MHFLEIKIISPQQPKIHNHTAGKKKQAITHLLVMKRGQMNHNYTKRSAIRTIRFIYYNQSEIKQIKRQQYF